MEADYSNQMNRDLAAGELDLAILYTPHFLPDLHYERSANCITCWSPPMLLRWPR